MNPFFRFDKRRATKRHSKCRSQSKAYFQCLTDMQGTKWFLQRDYIYRIILERLLVIPGNMLLNEDEHELIKGRDLVTGAIELTYRQMDQMVERQVQNDDGSCMAITILFLNGRLYAAGAGDSRAVLVLGEEQQALTRDCTPDSESNRIRALDFLRSNALLRHFTPLKFRKRLLQKGSLVLYREPFMTGWAYKTLTHPDLKLPLISGHGKRSRVMGTA